MLFLVGITGRQPAGKTMTVCWSELREAKSPFNTNSVPQDYFTGAALSSAWLWISHHVGDVAGFQKHRWKGPEGMGREGSCRNRKAIINSAIKYKQRKGDGRVMPALPPSSVVPMECAEELRGLVVAGRGAGTEPWKAATPRVPTWPIPHSWQKANQTLVLASFLVSLHIHPKGERAQADRAATQSWPQKTWVLFFTFRYFQTPCFLIVLFFSSFLSHSLIFPPSWTKQQIHKLSIWWSLLQQIFAQ